MTVRDVVLLPPAAVIPIGTPAHMRRTLISAANEFTRLAHQLSGPEITIRHMASAEKCLLSAWIDTTDPLTVLNNWSA